MKRTLLFCAIVAAALAVQPAKADTLSFSISFKGAQPSGNLFSGSAIFTASNLGGGEYDITGVLPGGSVTDVNFGTSSIVGLAPSFGGADQDLFYPNGGTYFDYNGLSFALANGMDVNLYDDGLAKAVESGDSGLAEYVTVSVSPTVAPTPEPSSFILLGTSAVAGAGEWLRRRRRSIA
jgi:hypothetical protein